MHLTVWQASFRQASFQTHTWRHILDADVRGEFVQPGHVHGTVSTGGGLWVRPLQLQHPQQRVHLALQLRVFRPQTLYHAAATKIL